MKLSINLELASLDQVRALEQALELFVDMESDRLGLGSKDSKATASEKSVLLGARQVQHLLSGTVAK